MFLKSKIGKKFEFTKRILNHIKTRHPIMEAYLNRLEQVLATPDEIRYSKYSQEVLLFYKYFANIEGGKYIAVVTKINRENFVLTTYLTDKIKSGGNYER